jgi:hypothetical protein
MTAAADSVAALLTRLHTELGGRVPHEAASPDAGRRVPLPARTDVAALSWASVAAASAAAADLAGAATIALDPDRIAIAYSSERHFRLDGEPMQAWAPLSGFFRSSDGWVRTHGNYPHHAAALRRGLGLGPDADTDAVAAALRGLPAGVATQAVTAAGGLCVGVSHENPVVDAELRDTPLVHLTRIAASPPRSRVWGPSGAPLRGIRVLDLTRVIAGPVATRTLALLGADVLRIDPPGLPEPEWQHLDSGHGKRSTLLDLTADSDRDAFERLLRTADVVVTGYRATALERIGLDPAALAARHPGIIVARLTAWGATGAAADRRGFDSLVQAASGIAWIESADGSRPGALPAQALDHSAGYLLAAGVMSTLRRETGEGGSWALDVSLRRVAAELLGMPRTDAPEPSGSAPDAAAHLQRFEVDGRELITALPAIAYEGGPGEFPPPRSWGGDPAAWVDA